MRIVRLVVVLVTVLVAMLVASPSWPIIDLTPEERVTLEDTVRMETENGHMRTVKRCQAILLLGAGERVADVAKMLDCSTKAVYQWVGRWRDGGLEGVRFRMNELRLATYHKAHFEERVAQIMAMRSARMTWSAIARELGYTTPAGPLRLFQRAFEQEEEDASPG